MADRMMSRRVGIGPASLQAAKPDARRMGVVAQVTAVPEIERSSPPLNGRRGMTLTSNRPGKGS